MGLTFYLEGRIMGQISRLKKVVREPVFRQRIEKNKKGKGSYTRKDKKVVSEDSKVSK